MGRVEQQAVQIYVGNGIKIKGHRSATQRASTMCQLKNPKASQETTVRG